MSRPRTPRLVPHPRLSIRNAQPRSILIASTERQKCPFALIICRTCDSCQNPVMANRNQVRRNVEVGHNERAAQDMAQAALMRGDGGGARRALAVGTSRAFTVDDVRLALRGLERAKELQSRDREEALRVYQLSIEALIRYLNTSPKRDGGLDREAVAERVRTALTDAERLKRAIDRGIERRSAERMDGAEPLGVMSSLSSALGALGLSPERKISIQAASEEEDAGRRTATVSPRKSAINSSPKARSSHPRRDDKKVSKRSNLDYSSDPIVKAIKSDLYVDSADIKIKWSDISGLATAKRSLQEAAILPRLRPDLYTGLRSPPKGILLYGPPGTGKTMLVKAVAHESKCVLFACTASAMTSKWHGEGEKMVRTLFKMAADVAPSILFFDEIDALLSSRKERGEHEASRRFKTEFMVRMDGIASGHDENDVGRKVLVIGCTNCPWDIDDAVMRRFQRRTYIPLPDSDARYTLLNNLLDKNGGNVHNLSTDQISRIVPLTEGYSCSDIASIAQEAAFGPLRSLGGIEDIRDAIFVRPINYQDFKDTVGRSKRSVTKALLAKYDAWEKEQSAGI